MALPLWCAVHLGRRQGLLTCCKPAPALSALILMVLAFMGCSLHIGLETHPFLYHMPELQPGASWPCLLSAGFRPTTHLTTGCKTS